MPRRFLPWAVAVGLVWSVGGLHVDGWAHTHGHADSGPFTPWHALVYSGTLFILCSLLSAFRADIRRGATWRTALDPGYRVALLGAIGFGVAGISDITWHLIFGVENSFSALMSPTHFMLNASICTIAGGALASSGMTARRVASWSDVLIASMLLSIFTFWSLFDDLFTNRYATGVGPDPVLGENPTLIMELGVFSVLYRSAVLAGVVLLLVRRFELPRGALTLMIGLNGVLLLFMLAPGDHAFVMPLLAGVLADVLYALLRAEPRAAAPAADLRVRRPVHLLGDLLRGAARAPTGSGGRSTSGQARRHGGRHRADGRLRHAAAAGSGGTAVPARPDA